MTPKSSPLLMSRLLDRGAEVAPNEEVVSLVADGYHRQTYEQTRARAHQLAHALNHAGIKLGERVGTFLWNHSCHLEAYHGISCMGAVIHTLNIRLAATDLEYIINHADDQIIIIDADLLPLLEPLAGRIPCVRQVVVASLDQADWQTSLPNPISYEDFISGQPTHYDWPVIDENAPLGLCYTSGTTGKPKGVQYTHRSTYLHTMAIMATDSMNLSAVDVNCGIVPMFHAMGWGLPWALLTLGAKQVMPNRFMVPEKLLQVIVDEKVTISQGVPTIWQGVKGFWEADPGRFDLSALSRLTCGGSAPPVSLIRWYWEKLQVEMIQGWGMTETGPLGTLSRRLMLGQDLALSEDERIENVSKAGRPLPGLQLDIFDEEFNRVPHDGESVGEVLIKGPWVCEEYYHDPQPDKFHDGWLITGDVAKMDAGGYLIIADRSKDLVKSGGEWISSVDLENHIVALEGVAQACVVAQPHPKWDERPIALVILSEGAELSAEQVVEHCSQKFAKWQLPDDVLFVEEIPLTSTGKMNKKVVRANLAADSYLLPDLREGKSGTA